MNQHFNIRRFFRYANYNVQTNKRLLILLIGGFSVALYVFELFLFAANRNWKSSNWTVLFFMILGVTGLTTIGHSFHYLRKQESSFRAFLLPVSTFEKFIYELLTKMVLFTALFFILFPLISDLATNTLEFLFKYMNIESFHYSNLKIPKEEKLAKTFFLGYLFVYSLAFAGAAAIKRFPLLKTLLFVGLICGSGILYIYILLEKLHLANGLEYIGEKIIKTEGNAFGTLFTVLIISTLTALTYAFFKLKEREV